MKNDMKEFQLLAGSAVTDITPPLEVGLLTSSVKGLYEPFIGIRLPLKARILVLKCVDDIVALVSLDLLALNDTSVGGWQNFKESISGIIPPEKIIITCTHTHSAPESVALSGLYLTEFYREWISQVASNIKHSIQQAINSASACKLSLSMALLEGYSLQRRIVTPEGIIMSDSIQPIDPILFGKEPVDRRVHTLCFRDAPGNTIATVVHAVCHPVHEMCIPLISAEFPGEMCLELEKAGTNGMPMFLNGAAGDINPPTVSSGPEYAHRHGTALADLAQGEYGNLSIDTRVFMMAQSQLQLATRPEAHIDRSDDAIARLNAIRIGSLAIVFLPGEPFIETALAIERKSPFKHTIVTGYCENSIGYIPTQSALEAGGYEVGPGKWSFLEKGAEELICKEALRLLQELFND